MDYIKQLEAFYSSLSFNPISSNAIAIYQYILHIQWKAGWVQEVSIANITLQGACSLSLKQIQGARNELINANFINYKKGRKPK